jgi:hypothetical protein
MTDVYGLDKAYIRPTVREKIRQLVNSDSATTEIWAWVHDDENLGAVRDITEAWLAEQARQAARYRTRQVERDSVRERPDIAQPVAIETAEEKAAKLLPAEVLADDGLPSLDYLKSNEAFDFRKNHPGTYQQIKSRRQYVDKAKEKQRLRDEQYSQRMRVLRRRMDESMEEWKRKIQVEWTEELLGKTFQLDGVEVAWGDATLEQHERRADWLKSHAAGTLETAGMHLKAIDALRGAGVRRLADIEEQA